MIQSLNTTQFTTQPTPGFGMPQAQTAPGMPQMFSPLWLTLMQSLGGNQTLGQGWNGFASGGDGQIRVAVIDDFVDEENGFNHGNNINSIIRAGGTITAGASSGANPGIETVLFNIDQPGGQDRNGNILQALNQIGMRAAQGEQFDAVNISQQDFERSGQTDAVAQAIRQLQDAFGIPVVVAAGNAGADERNLLADNAAFRVENSDFGSEGRAETSGIGNIRSEGEFTSQATANVTARVAQLREMGLSLPEIQATLAQEAAQEGGSLDGRPSNQITPEQQQAGAPADAGSYTVRRGDTVSALAKRAGISLQEFQRLNPQVKDLDLIIVGEKLNLPGGGGAAPSGSAPAPTPAPTATAPAPTPSLSAPVPFVDFEPGLGLPQSNPSPQPSPSQVPSNIF